MSTQNTERDRDRERPDGGSERGHKEKEHTESIFKTFHRFQFQRLIILHRLWGHDLFGQPFKVTDDPAETDPVPRPSNPERLRLPQKTQLSTNIPIAITGVCRDR